MFGQLQVRYVQVNICEDDVVVMVRLMGRMLGRVGEKNVIIKPSMSHFLIQKPAGVVWCVPKTVASIPLLLAQTGARSPVVVQGRSNTE